MSDSNRLHCYELDSIFENGGYTYISKPVGQGPFPGVLYSHGGLGGAIGGDLRGTCIALAQEGYICWAQLRTDTSNKFQALEFNLV